MSETNKIAAADEKGAEAEATLKKKNAESHASAKTEIDVTEKSESWALGKSESKISDKAAKKDESLGALRNELNTAEADSTEKAKDGGDETDERIRGTSDKLKNTDCEGAGQRVKKILRKIFFPPTAIILTLLPFSALFLIYMLTHGNGGAFSITSYLLAFYVLVVVSLRVPGVVALFRGLKSKNKYIERYLSDPELRVRISLYASLAVNIAYSVFQVGLGLVHSSLWYYSLGAYYITLALMRFFLVKFDRAERAEGQQSKRTCRSVGVLMLIMTLALMGVIFHMISLDVTIKHHQITAIAMSTYTFFAIGLALKQILKRKERSLVFTVSKSISLAAALVSLITLENTMITAFGTHAAAFLKTMVLTTGFAVCATVTVIAVNIIRLANKSLQNSGNKE